jgi:hypothetical protein
MTADDMNPDDNLPATKSDMRMVIDRLQAQDGNLRRLNLFAAETRGSFAVVDEQMKAVLMLKSDFARFQIGLDAMARQMESFERWCRSQGSMLMEHEARITKLESKPS